MKYELLGKLSLKCVLVGDSECGKTVLASRITSKEFRAEYVPTMFDNFAGKVIVYIYICKCKRENRRIDPGEKILR